MQVPYKLLFWAVVILLMIFVLHERPGAIGNLARELRFQLEPLIELAWQIIAIIIALIALKFLWKKVSGGKRR